MRQEKANADATIKELKKEHETNMNEITARHETELQVSVPLMFLCSLIEKGLLKAENLTSNHFKKLV